jgi:2-oxoglutarate ferredoxin oxidoreductase subunit gamma
MELCKIVFSGSGGQGVITAAIILAEAAVLHENLIAVQSQSYGPEARGGATRSDVIIADSEIRYPKVTQPNILVCLTQEAYNKYYGIIRPGGLLLYDPKYVNPISKLDAKQVGLPIYKTVMDSIGNPMAINICMLGAVIGLTGIVRIDSVVKVLQTRMSYDSLEPNKKALSLGLEMVNKFSETNDVCRFSG